MLTEDEEDPAGIHGTPSFYGLKRRCELIRVQCELVNDCAKLGFRVHIDHNWPAALFNPCPDDFRAVVIYARILNPQE